MEAPTDPYKPTVSCLGPTGHVNLLLDEKVISSYLSDRLPIYKSPLPFRQGIRDHSPLHFVNFLSSLLTPIVTIVHLQYETTGRRAITSKEGAKPG
jgi:hypothetical protein